MNRRYLKGWATKPVVIAVAIILVSTLAISSNIVGRSYTSDDVAHQTIAHDLTQPGPHTFGLSNESFFLKLPVYLAFNALMHPGRVQLVLESLLFNVAMVIFLLVWWRGTTKKSRDSWLIFIWLIAAGVYWMSQTINPNTRNFEVGLMFLFLAFAIRKILSPPSSRRSILLYVVGSSLLAGILIYNDPYFLFFGLIPLFIAISIYFLRQRKPSQILAAGSIFIISIAVNTFLQEASKHLGFSAGNSSVSSLATTLTPTGSEIIQVFNVSYLSLLGASMSVVHSNFRLLVEVILNLGVVCLAIYSLCYTIYKREFSLFNIWVLTTFVVTIGYVITAGSDVVYTARYLIILIPLTALLVLNTLQRLAQGPRKYYRLALTLISLSLCFNIFQSLITINHERHAAPNLVDNKIITALERNGVAKSYGNYWVANIAYYLSDYKANVLPVSCVNGEIYPDLVLVDTQRFKTSSAKTGIITTPDLVVATRSPYPESPSCTVKSTIEQFGKPQKIISVTPSVNILIYSHNPFTHVLTVGL